MNPTFFKITLPKKSSMTLVLFGHRIDKDADPAHLAAELIATRFNGACFGVSSQNNIDNEGDRILSVKPSSIHAPSRVFPEGSWAVLPNIIGDEAGEFHITPNTITTPFGQFHLNRFFLPDSMLKNKRAYNDSWDQTCLMAVMMGVLGQAKEIDFFEEDTRYEVIDDPVFNMIALMSSKAFINYLPQTHFAQNRGYGKPDFPLKAQERLVCEAINTSFLARRSYYGYKKLLPGVFGQLTQGDIITTNKPMAADKWVLGKKFSEFSSQYPKELMDIGAKAWLHAARFKNISCKVSRDDIVKKSIRVSQFSSHDKMHLLQYTTGTYNILRQAPKTYLRAQKRNTVFSFIE